MAEKSISGAAVDANVFFVDNLHHLSSNYIHTNQFVMSSFMSTNLSRHTHTHHDQLTNSAQVCLTYVLRGSRRETRDAIFDSFFLAFFDRASGTVTSKCIESRQAL